MSKRNKKGRRHRTVNRTPRPVTRSNGPTVRAASGAAGEPSRTLPQQSGSAASRTERAAVPETAGSRKTVQASVPQQETGGTAVTETQVFAPAREGGLGRSAAQTWRHLQERGSEGASLEELCEEVGYQQPTVAKHMAGLAGHSLVQQSDGRWYAVGSLR